MHMDDSLSSAPDASLPARSVGYRLWMLRHAWTRQVEAVLASTGLTHMQFFLLRACEHVALTGQVPSQTQLADFLHVDRMTVSKVVRTLEARRAVTRAAHPDDPRANGVELTDKGADLLSQATRLVLAEQDRFFGRLGADGRVRFETMIDQLLDQTGLCAAGPPSKMETP